jgi:imidazolonepropionase-like amidohydrolase
MNSPSALIAIAALPVLLLTNVTLIDGTGAPAQPNMTVVVKGDRIVTVAKAGAVHAPKGATIVDASGKFLVPGLWDMHVHFRETERSFPLFLANGVLGVRNMGGVADEAMRWRDEVVSGRVVGPRIVACGPIVDGPPPTSAEHALSVATAADGRKAVADLKRRGADFIKVYDGIPREAYFAIADEAKKLRFPFAGHIPTAVTAREASYAGQKSVEHLGGILEACSDDEDQIRHHVDPPIKDGEFSEFPRRIAARGERLLSTYDPAKAAELFAMFARNRTWQVPTLVVQHTWTFIDELAQTPDPRMKYIPASEAEWWSPTKNFLFRYRTAEFIAFRKKVFPKQLELVGEMHRAGVPFMAGTDVSYPYSFPGFSLHDELALFVEAGFTPMEALQSATVNPAKFLGVSERLGTVERGKIADLVLLDANPLENIKNTRRVGAVVVNGRYLSNAELRKMLAGAEAAAATKVEESN